MEDMNGTTQVSEWMYRGDAKINDLVGEHLQKKKIEMGGGGGG
jgi:hypothetical protein